MYTNTISARELQKSYKQILNRAQEINEPIIVITNNKPVGAIISIDLLKKLDDIEVLDQIVRDAQAEHRAGKTKKILNQKDLEKDLKQMEEEAFEE